METKAGRKIWDNILSNRKKVIQWFKNAHLYFRLFFVAD